MRLPLKRRDFAPAVVLFAGGFSAIWLAHFAFPNLIGPGFLGFDTSWADSFNIVSAYLRFRADISEGFALAGFLADVYVWSFAIGASLFASELLFGVALMPKEEEDATSLKKAESYATKLVTPGFLILYWIAGTLLLLTNSETDRWKRFAAMLSAPFLWLPAAIYLADNTSGLYGLLGLRS